MDNFYLVKSFEIPKYTSVLEKSIVLDKMLFRMEVKMSDQTSLLWVMVHIYIWSVSKKKKLHYLLEGELNFPTNTSKWRERERNNKLILIVIFFFTLLSNFISIGRDFDHFFFLENCTTNSYSICYSDIILTLNSYMFVRDRRFP